MKNFGGVGGGGRRRWEEEDRIMLDTNRTSRADGGEAK